MGFLSAVACALLVAVVCAGTKHDDIHWTYSGRDCHDFGVGVLKGVF